jgi:L-2-hydroxyglutarate oxidase LhgO
MGYLVRKASSQGAAISYESNVTGIEKMSEGYRVTIERDNFSFATRVVINCAGLNSDRIAEMVGIDGDEAGYRLHYCKGEYFSISDSKGRLVRRLIYPVPPEDSTALGIHVTPDLQGRRRLGPDAYYVDEIDYRVDESQRQSFYEAAVKLLPFIEPDDLEPEMVGIRPKLQGAGGDFRDFVINHEADRGLDGFINLIGIESPGLTASLAIARRVGGTVEDSLRN